MARAQTDRYFGLGDKTGAIDLHGRRLRTLALDALGYDAQTSDPLYKHWPFLLGRDDASGIAYGVYYDTLAPTTFDLGCEYDNYHGFYRYAEIDDGDLDYYLFVGPRIRDVVRKFTELTGRMALGPRWSLGYANTAMSLADAPDAQARLAEFADRATEHDIPLSAFHFGSGYTSIGKRRYVFTWNREKFPDPREAIAQVQASERARRGQSQALPARRPPGLYGGRGARRIRERRTHRRAMRRTVLGRRRRAPRLHSPRGYSLVAGRPASAGP